jgi:type I restriction enzyme R subunit
MTARLEVRMAQLQSAGVAFIDEQRWGLEKMPEHIPHNLGAKAEEFCYAPFDQRGGVGQVHLLIGAELPKVIDDLNRELVA